MKLLTFLLSIVLMAGISLNTFASNWFFTNKSTKPLNLVYFPPLGKTKAGSPNCTLYSGTPTQKITAVPGAAVPLILSGASNICIGEQGSSVPPSNWGASSSKLYYPNKYCPSAGFACNVDPCPGKAVCSS